MPANQLTSLTANKLNGLTANRLTSLPANQLTGLPAYQLTGSPANQFSSLRACKLVSLLAGELASLIALLFLLVSGCSSDWKYFGDDQNTTSYYSVRSLSLSSSGVARVWTKSVVKGRKGREYYSKTFGPRYKDFEYGKALLEINCRGKMFRVVSAEDFDAANNLIGSAKAQLNEVKITPDMVISNLYEKICQKP